MEKSLHSNEYMTFVSVLRQVRQDLGVTQEGLAMTLEAKQTFVSKCERGERRLDVVELRQWCKALGIDFADFAKRLDLALEESKQRMLLP